MTRTSPTAALLLALLFLSESPVAAQPLPYSGIEVHAMEAETIRTTLRRVGEYQFFSKSRRQSASPVDEPVNPHVGLGEFKQIETSLDGGLLETLCGLDASCGRSVTMRKRVVA